ncbi:hypothetical protein A0H81_10373 [Grifola frondosa]|uniref:Uncharacterized protein n=1 Tax=Grifola frondosa TaxID=5627 RepID=A0A1C7LYX1_GRIFR|nr:hypothetical protein A0H81_10373 [Grifola frondosa]
MKFDCSFVVPLFRPLTRPVHPVWHNTGSTNSASSNSPAHLAIGGVNPAAIYSPPLHASRIMRHTEFRTESVSGLYDRAEGGEGFGSTFIADSSHAREDGEYVTKRFFRLWTF